MRLRLEGSAELTFIRPEDASRPLRAPDPQVRELHGQIKATPSANRHFHASDLCRVIEQAAYHMRVLDDTRQFGCPKFMATLVGTSGCGTSASMIQIAARSANGRIIAIASAHHQLNYIHPFPDGKGRVSRLMSHELALEAGIEGQWLWSVSRGLADLGEYKCMTDVA